MSRTVTYALEISLISDCIMDIVSVVVIYLM